VGQSLQDNTEDETPKFVVTALAVAAPAATEVATTSLFSEEWNSPYGTTTRDEKGVRT
jgi:hypothetical protein